MVLVAPGIHYIAYGPKHLIYAYVPQRKILLLLSFTNEQIRHDPLSFALQIIRTIVNSNFSVCADEQYGHFTIEQSVSAEVNEEWLVISHRHINIHVMLRMFKDWLYPLRGYKLYLSGKDHQDNDEIINTAEAFTLPCCHCKHYNIKFAADIVYAAVYNGDRRHHHALTNMANRTDTISYNLPMTTTIHHVRRILGIPNHLNAYVGKSDDPASGLALTDDSMIALPGCGRSDYRAFIFFISDDDDSFDGSSVSIPTVNANHNGVLQMVQDDKTTYRILPDNTHYLIDPTRPELFGYIQDHYISHLPVI